MLKNKINEISHPFYIITGENGRNFGAHGFKVKSVSPVMQHFSHILHVLLCRCLSLFTPLLGASGRVRIRNLELDPESGNGTGIRARKVDDIQLFYFSENKLNVITQFKLQN